VLFPRRIALILALGAALAVGCASCVTPSIPIPPPEAQNMSFTVDPSVGTATFQYAASVNYGGARVYVFNRTQGQGIIDTAREDGSVGPTAPFPAAIADEVSITFETDEQAVSTCVVVREGVPSQICGS
jgi:hypothetical protein